MREVLVVRCSLDGDGMPDTGTRARRIETTTGGQSVMTGLFTRDTTDENLRTKSTKMTSTYCELRAEVIAIVDVDGGGSRIAASVDFDDLWGLGAPNDIHSDLLRRKGRDEWQ